MPGWLLLTSSPEREGSTGQVLIFLATLSLARIAPVLDVASSNRSSYRKGYHSLPGAPTPYPESHPFAWFPLAGQRHAIDRRDRNVPLDAPMRCLCGVTHPRGPDGDMEWLWPTCEWCWDEACRIVGVRRQG